MQTEENSEFWSPRKCLRSPIPEIFEAAKLLDRAVTHHLLGNHDETADLILQTDRDDIRDFTESLWGSRSKNPDQQTYIRWRPVSGLPEPATMDLDRKRKPNRTDEDAVIARWGRHCVFCGVPLIRNAVPRALQTLYPDLLIWRSNRNADQHAAFQLMWMQFDHVVPHCRAGRTDIENIVVTCSPCNYGKGDWMIEELGLVDPRSRPGVRTSWDGLERMFS